MPPAAGLVWQPGVRVGRIGLDLVLCWVQYCTVLSTLLYWTYYWAGCTTVLGCTGLSTVLGAVLYWVVLDLVQYCTVLY